MTDGVRRPLARISEDPVVRVAAYYVLLASATALLWQVFPGLAAVFSAERLDAVSATTSQSDPLLEALGASVHEVVGSPDVAGADRRDQHFFGRWVRDEWGRTGMRFLAERPGGIDAWLDASGDYETAQQRLLDELPTWLART